MPVVILHGLYGMSDNWLSIVRKLEHRYKFILPDLRNHGDSDFDNDHSYNAMVADVLELLSDLNLNKVVLLGHSMGGKVAMLFALTYPEFVHKLIVVDIAPKNYLNATNFGAETSNHNAILNTLSSRDITFAKSRNAIDDLFKNDLKDKSVRMFLLKNVKRFDDGSFGWHINLPVLKGALNDILTGFDSVDNESLVPALFIRGGLSPYINPDDIFYIKKYFPNAELVSIENAGHWVHAQQPELLINTITFFLQ